MTDSYSFPSAGMACLDAAPFADRRGAFSLAIDKRYTPWDGTAPFPRQVHLSIDGHTRIDSPISVAKTFQHNSKICHGIPTSILFGVLVCAAVLEAATQDKSPAAVTRPTPGLGFMIRSLCMIH